MFGGLADVNPNNTWTYDGAAWTQQSPAVNHSWCTPRLPLSTPGYKESFSLEVEAAVKTRTRRGDGIRLAPRGYTSLRPTRRPPAKVLA